MIRLSVNINKIATLRNARGGNNPNLLKIAQSIERFGAQGITVHPRPDQRHVRYADVLALKQVLTTDFNIEGYPEAAFLQLVIAAHPAQCTLVPDAPDALTSSSGWDTKTHQSLLKETIAQLNERQINVSVFIDPKPEMAEYAALACAQSIELYTESYASGYHQNKETAIKPYILAAEAAHGFGLGINAGHDLDLYNLKYFAQNIRHLKEVSIGHALICDALYFGLENTVQLYKRLVAPN